MRAIRLIRLQTARAAKKRFRRIRNSILRARASEPLEFEQIVIRYLVGIVITAYTIYSYAFEAVHQRSGSSIAILILCAWILGLALLLHLAIWPDRRVRRRAASIIGDAVAMSLLLGLGEKTAALFFPVYLWVILGNGFRYGLPYLYAAITANLIGFVTMAAMTTYWRDAWQFSAGLAIAIIIIPLYAAKLIRNLREAMNEAEEASRAKTDFLSMMSHELRTPVAAILGLAHVSKATAASPNERFSAISTELAASRLLRMLDAILKFQRIESGQSERQDKPFDLVEILNEVRAITEPLAQQKQLDFRIRFASGVPAALLSDPDHIQTIILNLVTNAVKYTREGSVALEVGMIGDPVDPWLRAAVRDTGSGITREEQSRIFDRFVRAQEHNVSDEPGVGLGLAMCRSLTELLGGRLDFESTPGAGSLFWVELPVGLGEDGAAGAASSPIMAPVLAIDGALSDAVIEAVGAAKIAEADALDKILGGNDLSGQLIALDPGALTTRARKAILELMSVPGRHAALVLIERGAGAADGLDGIAAAVAKARSDGEIVDLIRTVARWQHCLLRDFETDRPVVTPLSRRLTVLIADDNQLNRQVIRRMLDLDGHQVLLAATGDEALDALLEGRADIALLDVNMPGMSGIDVCRAYRSGLGSGSRTPLLGLTADISEQTRAECLAAGMAQVLSKPVTFEQLRDALARYAAGSAATGDARAAAAGQGRPSATTRVDEERVAALRDLFGEDGVRDDFLPSFERDLLASLDQLRGALGGSRPQPLREALHALKSSASTAGACQIVDDVDRFQERGGPADFPAFEAGIEAAFAHYCMTAFGEARALGAPPPSERSASRG
jgi:two-component system sensor histidine kinase RpfC